MDHGLGDVRLAEFEAVLEHRELWGVIAQPVHELGGALAEVLIQRAVQVVGGDDLRTLGVQLAVAHADLIDAIHELGDEEKAEARLAEGVDAALRGADDLRVLDGVVEGVLVQGGERVEC